MGEKPLKNQFEVIKESSDIKQKVRSIEGALSQKADKDPEFKKILETTMDDEKYKGLNEKWVHKHELLQKWYENLPEHYQSELAEFYDQEKEDTSNEDVA